MRLSLERLESRDTPAPMATFAFPGLAERLGVADPEDAYPSTPEGRQVFQAVCGEGNPNLYVLGFIGTAGLPADDRGVITSVPLDAETGTMGWRLSNVQFADGSWGLVVTPREGGGPRVQVFSVDAKGTLTLVSSFFVAEDTFRGGVAAVSQIDGDGDGRSEVAVFMDGGGRTVMRTYDPLSGTEVSSHYVADAEGYRPVPAGFGRYMIGPTYTRPGFLVSLYVDGVEHPETTRRVYLDTWETSR